MSYFVAHFAWAYVLAMGLAGPHLLGNPIAWTMAVPAFPGGIFGFIEPAYSFNGGPQWPAIAGFCLYAIVLVAGQVTKRRWPLVALAALLVINIVGCHVQHSHRGYSP